jgi:hypothetical protein
MPKVRPVSSWSEPLLPRALGQRHGAVPVEHRLELRTGDDFALEQETGALDQHRLQGLMRFLTISCVSAQP